MAFQAFACYDFNDDGRWLIADLSVQCDTEEHTRLTILAWLAIALYPLGQLALYAGLLFFARNAIRNLAPSLLSRALDFIHQSYKPEYFWWECAEMVRFPKRLCASSSVLLCRESESAHPACTSQLKEATPVPPMSVR